MISLIFFLVTFACGSEREAPNTISVFKTDHFDFYYSRMSSRQLEELGTFVETHYSSLLRDLGVAITDRIAIHFYYDNAGVRIGSGFPNFPAWSIGLATARDQIHMISPYGGSVSYNMNNIVHEIAHCVSMYINPRIPNKPRWLWESIAIYEAGQFVDPQRLNFLKTNPPKRLTEFDDISNTRIYDVGFLLSEFVIEKWGMNKLIELIRQNGDTNVVVGLDDEVFVDAWLTAVRDKYSL